MELWPFAYATSYWGQLWDCLVVGSRTDVVAFVSPSAHPASWVAARRLAQEVFVCARRFPNHAHRHTLQFYEDIRRKDIEPPAPPAAERGSLPLG